MTGIGEIKKWDKETGIMAVNCEIGIDKAAELFRSFPLITEIIAGPHRYIWGTTGSEIYVTKMEIGTAQP